MQAVMNIISTIIKIMADLGVTKIIHTMISDLFRDKKLKKTTKACVYVGEFMAVAIIGKQNDKLIDSTIDKVSEFIVDHDLDKKLSITGGKKNAGEKHSDER